MDRGSVIGWGLLAAVTQGNGVNQYELFTLGFFPACTTAIMLGFLLK